MSSSNEKPTDKGIPHRGRDTRQGATEPGHANAETGQGEGASGFPEPIMPEGWTGPWAGHPMWYSEPFETIDAYDPPAYDHSKGKDADDEKCADCTNEKAGGPSKDAKEGSPETIRGDAEMHEDPPEVPPSDSPKDGEGDQPGRGPHCRGPRGRGRHCHGPRGPHHGPGSRFGPHYGFGPGTWGPGGFHGPRGPPGPHWAFFRHQPPFGPGEGFPGPPPGFFGPHGRGGGPRCGRRGHCSSPPPAGSPPTGNDGPSEFRSAMQGLADHPYGRAIQQYIQHLRDSLMSAARGPNAAAAAAAAGAGVVDSDDNTFVPAIDLFNDEAARAWIVHVSLPGAKKEDIGIRYDREAGRLTVSGVVHRPGDERFIASLVTGERRIGMFERVVDVPPPTVAASRDEAVEMADITARMEEGLLIVTLPKVEPNQEWTEVRKVDIE